MANIYSKILLVVDYLIKIFDMHKKTDMDRKWETELFFWPDYIFCPYTVLER
jgi:hypothetical protein